MPATQFATQYAIPQYAATAAGQPQARYIQAAQIPAGTNAAGQQVQAALAYQAGVGGAVAVSNASMAAAAQQQTVYAATAGAQLFDAYQQGTLTPTTPVSCMILLLLFCYFSRLNSSTFVSKGFF